MQRARDSGSLWRCPQSLVQVIRPFASRAVVVGLGDVFCLSAAPATKVTTIKINEASATFLITLDALEAVSPSIPNCVGPPPLKIRIIANPSSTRDFGMTKAITSAWTCRAVRTRVRFRRGDGHCVL